MENCKCASVHRCVNIRVVKNDVGTFATEFKLYTLQIACRVFNNFSTSYCRTSKCNLCNIVMTRKSFASRVAKSRHDVDNTRRESNLTHQFSKSQTGERSQFAGLEHTCITGSKCWTHLPTTKHQWKIPRHDCPNNSKRFANDIIQKSSFNWHNVALNLVSHASEISKTSSRSRNIQKSRVFDWVTRIQTF